MQQIKYADPVVEDQDSSIFNYTWQHKKQDKNYKIAKFIKKSDMKEQIEKFKHITGPRRVQYAADNSYHTKDNLSFVVPY